MSSPSHETLLPQLALPDGVTVWDGGALDRERRHNNTNGRVDHIMQTINILGTRSREAQCLNATLTSVARLRENAQARVYLLCQGGYGVGILKMGVKKLFVTHPSYASLVEIDPLCVLDFFVDTSSQRRGFGKTLFDAMLLSEGLSPGEVAIDRPSVKFLAFLRKHYGLVEYTPQSNNFVVFHKYFDKWQPQRGRGQRGGNAASTRSPVRPQGCPRARPEGHGTTGAGNNPDDATPRSPPPPPQAPKGPLAPPAPRSRTTYELQYEEYLREQARRREQRDQRLQPVSNPVSSSEVAAVSCGARRRVSPTRSGVQYNIISGAQER